MFHMSLKYIHLLHVSTSLGHLQVTFFFQGVYRTTHIVTRTLKYAVICIFLVLYCVPSSHFLCYGCSAPLGMPPLGRVRAVLFLCSLHFIHWVRKMFTAYYFGGDISYESRLQCLQKSIS
jgi:hypothetical protein